MLKQLLFLLLLAGSAMADPIHLGLYGMRGEFPAADFGSSVSDVSQTFATRGHSGFLYRGGRAVLDPVPLQLFSTPASTASFSAPFADHFTGIYIVVIGKVIYLGPDGPRLPYGIGGFTLSLNHLGFDPWGFGNLGPKLDPVPGADPPSPAVPEPATLALLGSGLAAIVVRRWRH